MRTQLRSIAGQTFGRTLLAGAVGLLPVAGCAEQGDTSRPMGSTPAEPRSVISADSYDGAATPPAARMLAAQAPAVAEPPAPASPAPPPARKAATAGRKIIYDASVDLVTEDLNKLEAGLLRLVETQGAYVADSNRSGTSGANRRGMWKVRVPAEGYDAFVRGAIGLGELVSTRAQSQDVSAEYYDLDARTGAKKVEEARLLKHLADSTGRLEEILAVERELTRVRSEIEQMQGRLAVLGSLTTLATVTVTAGEIKDYVPPQTPTLAQKVGRTFGASVGSLRSFGEAVLLLAVAVAPWLPLIIPAALLAVVVVRRSGTYLAANVGVPPAR